MSGFGIPSKYEWECPVCGAVINMHHEHIGDPPKCNQCGHYMQPKVYHKEITPYRTDMRCDSPIGGAGFGFTLRNHLLMR